MDYILFMEHEVPITPGEIRAIAARIKRKNTQEQGVLELRRAKARKIAYELAQKIGTSDPEIQEIWGFGSVFELWRKYRMDSDIDLAMTGGNWFSACSLAEHPEFPVSLIDMNDTTAEFNELLKKNGVLLYERT